MVEDKLMRVIPLMIPAVCLILALVNVNTHAKNVPLEPIKLLYLTCHWGHRGTTTTSPSITHEGLRGSGGVMSLLSLVVDFLGLMNTIQSSAKILMGQHMLDEHHYERSIRNREPVDHSIRHLMKNIVHDIQFVTCGLSRVSGTLVSKSKEWNQVATDPVIVATTRSDAVPKYANKGGIQG